MITIIVFGIQLVLLAILNSLGMTEHSNWLISIMIAASSVAFFATISKKRIYKRVNLPLTMGYFIRVFFLYFDLFGRNIMNLPNSGGDTENFYNSALKFAAGNPAYRSTFSDLIGIFFRVFGISRLYVQYILLFFSIIALMYAIKIMNLLQIDLKRTRIIMWILSLLPNFAIISSILLRESTIVMLLSISIYFMMLWVKRKREWYFLTAAGLSVLAMVFHSGVIAVPASYLILRILYDNQSEKYRLKVQNIVAALVLLILGMFLFARFGNTLLKKFSGLDSVEDISSGVGRGGSSYAQYVGNSSSILNMILYAIPRVVFFLFSPMPWMLRGFRDVITFLFSSCFYIFTVFSTIRYFVTGKKDNRSLVWMFVIICACTAFIFSWGTTNAGTATRHREKMAIIWGLLLALTMKTRKRKPSIY